MPIQRRRRLQMFMFESDILFSLTILKIFILLDRV